MGKSVGFIGNFKGKLGNAVGYKVSQSNSGTNQGVRVYQPNIKNPKSAAQAEQRAKYAPIFATYRALKMIIDRGNESKPYGNASRIAWLKQAFKAKAMPWYVKGAVIEDPVVCQLTKGSLAGLDYTVDDISIIINAANVKSETDLSTIGKVSTALLQNYPSLKEGDQITLVHLTAGPNALQTEVYSFIIKSDDTTPANLFTPSKTTIAFTFTMTGGFGAAIVSREGANGEHLRSTSQIKMWEDLVDAAPFDAASKAAAIESYMSSASANADWAEESIQ